MKAVTDIGKRHESDYYISTLAPIDHRHECRFCSADVLILCVLFLEVAGLMRLLLAN